MVYIEPRDGTVLNSDLTNTPDVLIEAGFFFLVFAANKRRNTLQYDTPPPYRGASPQRKKG